MLRWGIGIISALLVVSSCGGAQGADVSKFDIKLNKMVTEKKFWQGEASETVPEKSENDSNAKSASQGITFSETFDDISYGDIIGHMEVEVTRIDCDIVYAADRNDAILRSRSNDDCVYLYFTEGGKGLNASYMNLFVAESLMPDYEEMEDIVKCSDKRYLHVWIDVNGEQLQMDMLGAYYSDDMQTNHGRMQAMIETDFIPAEAARSDTGMLEYLMDCVNYMPDDYTYDKMIVLDNLQYGNMEHKRIIVAVNVPGESVSK